MNKKSLNRTVKLFIIFLTFVFFNIHIVEATCFHNIALSPAGGSFSLGNTFSLPITFSDNSPADCGGSMTYSVHMSYNDGNDVSITPSTFTTSSGQSASATLNGKVANNPLVNNYCMIRVDVLDNMGYIVGAENFYLLASCDSNHCKACSASNCPSTGCYVCSQDNMCYPDTTSGRCACGLATDTDNKDYNVKGTCTQTNYLCQKTIYGDYCPLEKDNSLCCKALPGQYWHVNINLGNGDFECCRTEYPMLYGGCLETKNTSCKGVLVEYYAVGKECKSEYHDCSNDGKVCSNGACVAVIPGQTCSDGTSYGICSAIKPKYCDNGNLIDKCTQCGCPPIQNCNTTSDACYTPTAVSSVSLQSGWNMVSLSVNTPISASELQNRCGANTRIWIYNPFSKSYESASEIRPGSGYWVKLDSACSVSVTGSAVQSLPDLKTGWNQIGALSATTDFNSVKGNCNVKSGPFKYNPTSRRYIKTISLESGYGYWLNVGNDCKLG